MARRKDLAKLSSDTDVWNVSNAVVMLENDPGLLHPGGEKFIEDFIYVSKEAARFLVDRRVRTVGVDYLSVGGFLYHGVETHQILLGSSVWVIEGLNLSQVTRGDYELACLPLKLRGSDGAPARAVVRPLRSPA